MMLVDHVSIGVLLSDENYDVNKLNNDSVTQFKTDTGAQASVLPISTLKRLSTKPPIDKDPHETYSVQWNKHSRHGKVHP